MFAGLKNLGGKETTKLSEIWELSLQLFLPLHSLSITMSGKSTLQISLESTSLRLYCCRPCIPHLSPALPHLTGPMGPLNWPPYWSSYHSELNKQKNMVSVLYKMFWWLPTTVMIKFSLPRTTCSGPSHLRIFIHVIFHFSFSTLIKTLMSVLILKCPFPSCRACWAICLEQSLLLYFLRDLSRPLTPAPWLAAPSRLPPGACMRSSPTAA